MTTIITGAGASGLAAAITLKQNLPDEEVIVLERLSSAGRKILATGNGRCNLTNTCAENYSEVRSFFEKIGLFLRCKEQGRVYPYSLKAETVLEILLEACDNLGVKIITDCEVTSIKKNLEVSCAKGTFKADSIILCTGGTAQRNLGSNGSGYSLVKALGHSVTPLSPALVQLTSSSKHPRALSGTRVRCGIRIELDGKAAGEEHGEILFTDYGISGIAAMNLSYIVGKNFSESVPEKCVAVLDLTPEISADKLSRHIEEFGTLRGILGSRLWEIIIKQADGDLHRAVKITKSWRLVITGTKGFDFAQITNGGVPLSETDRFESKAAENIFICGELLDRQFPCGGFNLDFAWHSGISAANRITRKRYDKNK